MSTSFELPPGYNFVDQEAIDGEQLMRLLDEVVTANEGESHYPDPSEEAIQVTQGKYQKANRLALGIIDDDKKLVAYASASIDESDSHASVDCLVVSELERGRGLGRLLVNHGLSIIDTTDVKTAGFEPFGEVHRLVPYLVTQKGFYYVHEAKEFVSYRETAGPLNGPILGPKQKENTPSIEESNISNKELINEEQRAEFREAVKTLVNQCVERTNTLNPRMPIIANDTIFILEKAGRRIDVMQSSVAGYQDWRIVDISDELVPTPGAVVISTERDYQVWQVRGEEDTAVADFYQKLEIRGHDGAMRQFNDKNPDTGRFTIERFNKIMTILNKLGPENLTSTIII